MHALPGANSEPVDQGDCDRLAALLKFLEPDLESLISKLRAPDECFFIALSPEVVIAHDLAAKEIASSFKSKDEMWEAIEVYNTYSNRYYCRLDFMLRAELLVVRCRTSLISYMTSLLPRSSRWA